MGGSRSPSVVRIERLVVGGPIEPWERLGLTLVDSVIALHGTGVRVDPTLGAGLQRWELSGTGRDAGERFEIDGIASVAVDPPRPLLVQHRLGLSDVDHVVVVTDDLERTCAAITEATGAERRRVREAGDVRQGFHRLGALIVEVVEHPRQVATGFFGIALNTDDLDAVVTSAGEDLIGTPKPAVQPGRRIATVRREAELGVPVAVMSRTVSG